MQTYDLILEAIEAKRKYDIFGSHLERIVHFYSFYILLKNFAATNWINLCHIKLDKIVWISTLLELDILEVN